MSQTQTTNTVEQTGAEAVQNLGSQAASTEVAPQQTETPVVETPTQDTTAETKEVPEGVTKRFAELTAQREEAKRATDEAIREKEFYKKLALERSESTRVDPSAPAAPAKTEELVEPKIEDFTDYADFVKSAVTYQIKKELQTLQVQSTQNRTQTERVQKFHTAAETFKKETPDFETTISNPTFVQSPPVVEAILYSAKGPQVAYFLAKNPAVLSKLNESSPFEVALEIGRIEERLSVLPPKVIPQAPKPLETVSGTNEAVQKDPKEMNMDEYAQANAHRFKWQGKRR